TTSLLTIAFLSILIHHSLCEKHSKLSLHFFWVRSVFPLLRFVDLVVAQLLTINLVLSFNQRCLAA
ncbi:MULTISPECIES: hypothetical protein, partial [unclassified Wolbachia]|uniref:hypothetical protein n=1 Tax=unclassified Wolbachia TaxID=2640676 RepID=UPI001C54D180